MKELDEFKYINRLLLDKISKWNKPNDFDYHEYFINEGLNCEKILEDFKSAVDIIEKFNLSEKIYKTLEK